jgi:hypothetical protein
MERLRSVTHFAVSEIDTVPLVPGVGSVMASHCAAVSSVRCESHHAYVVASAASVAPPLHDTVIGKAWMGLAMPENPPVNDPERTSASGQTSIASVSSVPLVANQARNVV